MEVHIEHMEEYELLELLAIEKESLGFYVSGHPLDKYRKDLEQIKYTLSSEIEELADGSQAILVGKVEDIVEKISKKGNKFAIAHILDLHGNIELLLFENRLQELYDNFNLNEPIAFKVRISKGENFTRMSILKIESLQEAKREKVKIKKEIKQTPKPIFEPITIFINLTPDVKIIEELYHLAVRCKGQHPLRLYIKSEKLSDVIIESNIRVSKTILDEVRKIGIGELASVS
jgi:DNA polymerase-3 subunit alpha